MFRNRPEPIAARLGGADNREVAVTEALSPAARHAHAQSVRLLATAMFRTGVRFGAIATAGSLLVATMMAGWAGFWGAAVGTGLGFLSSLATIGLMRLGAAMPAQALFGAVMGGYAVKIGLLMVVALPLRRVEQLEPLALGLSVLAVVFAWVIAEVVAFRRTPIPTIIPDPDPPERSLGAPH